MGHITIDGRESERVERRTLRGYDSHQYPQIRRCLDTVGHKVSGMVVPYVGGAIHTNCEYPKLQWSNLTI